MSSGIDRKRQSIQRSGLRARKVPFFIAQVLETFLKVKRNRIVDFGFNALAPQESSLMRRRPGIERQIDYKYDPERLPAAMIVREQTGLAKQISDSAPR